MTTRFLAVAFLLFVANTSAAAEGGPHVLRSFERRPLSDKFYAEGAGVGDFNRDGAVDIVAGPFIFWGPSYESRIEIYPVKDFSIEAYSENFFAWPHDVDGDGWLDIVSVGFPGNQACWFRNPQGKAGYWERHVAAEHVDNESPAFADVTGDGRPELVFHVGGRFGFAEIPGDMPTALWRFTLISDDRKVERFNHGLGVGDLNSDGRADVLERTGWWEQPADRSAQPLWTYHPVRFADAGGAQMLVDDFDGDGDADVVTSKAAHAYGLSWFEQRPDANGAATFVEHSIMGDSPDQNDYGVSFSQLHALALADVDGDGVNDFVTGKRFWAHSTHDPGSLDRAVLYWFRTVRENGTARFVPNEIDDASGVGTDVTVADLNGDKRLDIVIANKKGIFAFTQNQREVDQVTYDAAQPTRVIATPTATTSNPSQPPADAGGSNEAKAQASPASFPATAADGRPLNFDFETGDLRDWTPQGAAFDRQPIRGDTIAPRRADMASGHQGQFWIGTFEIAQDQPQGTLVSVPFEVTHPFASFLIGGGSHADTRVEIVRQGTSKTIFTARGSDAEQLRRVAVDLSEHQGQQVFLRIVDGTSWGWGHVNFDDFKFHDAKPDVSFTPAPVLKADEYPYSRLPGEEAAAAMHVPEGFSVSLFAAEPDIQQPIAMALDDRGRVWVAEAYEYPQRAPGDKGRDRILVFEDADGDGQFDNRKVFAEGLNLVSGLEVGHGGVWVGAAPYLMFIPDANGDDVPDGPPQILLDGWGWQDTHETLNTFIWGPDGWLYGCHGVFTHSRVGRPGTPDADRTAINAGIWRYHPTRHTFEVFAQGTSNPWGVDFDDHGQAFATACVIPHLYHVIQGARYERQAGEHFNRFTYDDIKTIADHRHFVGAWNSPHAGNGRSDSAGGGHAHAGAMIYLGGAWPDEYRGKLLMNNIHGQRLNMDSLHAKGSGFVGSHQPDFLLTGDRASQMLNIRYGPDGQAYVIDWYDMQACHDTNSDVHDRTNGRIYKVNYGTPTATVVDLWTKSDAELVELVLENNDWYVRHARKQLAERFAAGKLDANVRQRLVELATTNPDATRRLRAMWALHGTGGLPDEILPKFLADQSEYVRAWTIQLGMDADEPQRLAIMDQLATLAQKDPSPVVRLYVASAAGRIPVERRWDVVSHLSMHSEDASDHNLPLMVWYAAEPLVPTNPGRALELGIFATGSMPKLSEYIARRVGAIGTPESLALLVQFLGDARDPQQAAPMLAGLRSAVEGRRQVEPPANWSEVSKKLKDSEWPELRDGVLMLGVKFGDESAQSALRELAASPSADAAKRREALEALLAARDAKLGPILRQLLDDSQLRTVALRGLASYDDAETADAILKVYDALPLDDKRTALGALAARPASAARLLGAVGDGKIPLTDLSADLVRQLGALQDEKVAELAAKVWGTVRSTSADKAALIAKYKTMWESDHAVEPDRELGRTMFVRTCQQCHTLYGAGAKIGPDLTGSNRSDINYLLSNIVDPNALIAKEYQTTVIMTSDGRVISGIVEAQDDKSVTIKNTTETLVIPRDEIDDQSLGETSMMPENQLQPFTDHEVLSLFAYLTDTKQSPMLATKETAELLYSGRDLAGWTGDPKIWRVEDGQIVGSMPGLDHNSFLVSDMSAADFRLSFEVLLANNKGNSGVQFRSKPLGGYREVEGLQADVGPDWWGKLYEEHGRELLWDKSGESFVKPGDWNKYVIEAVGPRVRTWINGGPCVDYEDAQIARRGVFALQMHSGDATEVRFRNFKLEILGEASRSTTK